MQHSFSSDLHNDNDPPALHAGLYDNATGSHLKWIAPTIENVPVFLEAVVAQPKGQPP